jgi:hypothetical protein
MTRRIAAFAALLALGAFGAIAAQAGEITLYENAGFDGRAVTLRGSTPNFADVGFNDSATSIVVRAGTWEVCTGAQFKGRCLTLRPGEYSGLDETFNDRVSSTREVGRNGSDGNYGRGSIELFGQRDFRGASIRLERDTGNFHVIGFNDRASSVIVHDGTWVLCTDADYGGNCRTYPPGRYSDLGNGMDRLVSSARVVRARGEAPVVHVGSWPGRPNLNGAARVVLNDHDNMRGRELVVSDNVTDLQRTGFGNATASMIVEGGSWEFCADSYFRGVCRVLGPGRYPLLEPPLYRSISSIRAAAPDSMDRRPGTQPGDIVLFDDVNLDGRSVAAQDKVPNLTDLDFNHQTSSLIVYSGQWEICTDAGFSGRCAVFGPGRYDRLGGLNKQISSLRRIE